jgi:hypothetical protein
MRMNVVRVDSTTGDKPQAASSWNRITYGDFHALDRMLTVVFADKSGSIVPPAAPAATGSDSGSGSAAGSASGSAAGSASGSGAGSGRAGSASSASSASSSRHGSAGSAVLPSR